MGKVRRTTALVWISLIVAACSPIVAGPELPRPAVTAMKAPPLVSTTTVPVARSTATTLDPADAMAAECPTSFCLVYTINGGATWSDGSAVTSDDFVRTYQAAVDSSDDPGYRLIRNVDVVDEKRARVVFDEPYGPWMGLFGRLVPPDGAGSGPFRLVDWVPGDRIVVERVDPWWPDEDPVSGSTIGNVREITFLFISEMSDMADALEDGDVDVILGRPDVEAIETLVDLEDVDFEITPGRFWEHVEFHHDDRLLGRRWLREALALAIDREAILARTARLFDPGSVGLSNTLFMTGDRSYESHYDETYDPAGAERILVDNGCERGVDDVYVCAGARLSFTWATTNDDPARRETFDVVQENLASVGIEVVATFRTPSAFLSSDFILGGPDTWQMANFAWRADDDPSGSEARYSCGESLFNVSRYCSPEIEALFADAMRTVDSDTRNALYNDADRLYLEDLAVLPLYQKPELMAWNTELTGPIPNHSSSSELWNVAAWSGKSSIVVAIPDEPDRLLPFSTTDDNANRVLAATMYGALGMDPSLQPLYVLVDSVEVVEG